MRTDRRVAVIIAAWNAQGTIGRAIASALVQPEVEEVIVIDDGSTDETAAVARAAAGDDARLSILRSGGNQGPAAARNLGIAASRSAYVSILDADDFLLPGRFAAMFEHDHWDAVADNIAFVPEVQAPSFDPSSVMKFEPNPKILKLAEFITANIARPGKPRGELGFMKPVIRRAFLESHRLRYSDDLRLGEDFALYAALLAAGGLFLTIRSCGYVAVERPHSLSGRHGTNDLAALLAFTRKFERSQCLGEEEAAAAVAHRRQLEQKVHHRMILDTRARHGRLAAFCQALLSPTMLPHLFLAVGRDKIARPQIDERTVRYLF